MKKKTIKISNILIIIILTIITFFQMFPFYMKIVESLQPDSWIEQIDQWNLWPKSFTLNNYMRAWKEGELWRGYINSTIYVSAYTFLTAIIAQLVGYVIAKKQFRGRKVIFIALISTMMVPGEVLLIPNFIMCRDLGLINHLTALVFPGLVNTFGIFLAKQFMETLPDSVIESAVIDGAGELTIFTKIILPMAKAAMSTYVILTFTAQWTDYLWPDIVLNDFTKFPIQLSMKALDGRTAASFGVDDYFKQMKAAGLIMTSLPPVILFLVFQRNFMDGFVISGIK